VSGYHQTQNLSDISSGYLYNVFSDITRIKQKTVTKLRAIEKHYPQFRFEAIAFRGMSGALIAPMVAEAMNKQLILVRKGESSHSDHEVEGYRIALDTHYIILDDLISSGETVKVIVEKIHEHAPSLKCVGSFEYEKMHYGEDTLEAVLRQGLRVWAGSKAFDLPRLQWLTTTGRKLKSAA
jgi:orotate phosphoribosyltransferase